MSAQMLQSLGPMLGGGGQTPDVAGMAPDMGAIAQQYGSGQAPAAASAAPSGQDALYAQMAKNLQQQSTLAPLQGLADVGSAYINKNVEARHQAPYAAPFGMATSQMGPLPFGSSQSPLLAYLSMLGSKG